MSTKEGEKTTVFEKIGIIGDGRFAEALAYLISKIHKDVEVVLWTYKEEYVERAEKKGTFRHSKKKNRFGINKRIKLPENVRITHNAKDVANSDVLIPVLSAQKTRENIETHFQKHIIEFKDRIQAIISGTKGIERETGALMSEVWEEIFSVEDIDILEKYGVLAGLNFASDMIDDHPMVANVASSNVEVQKTGYELLNDPQSFFVVCSNDVKGAEIGGAVKNPIAIAAGAARSLYGDSAAQAIVAAGISELKKFADKFGAKKTTFDADTPVIADLNGTAGSRESRNFQEGEARALKKKRKKTGIAEGVTTAPPVVQMAEGKKVKMPVCKAVLEITQGTRPIEEIVGDLLGEIGEKTHSISRLSWMKNTTPQKDA